MSQTPNISFDEEGTISRSVQKSCMGGIESRTKVSFECEVICDVCDREISKHVVQKQKSQSGLITTFIYGVDQVCYQAKSSLQLEDWEKRNNYRNPIARYVCFREQGLLVCSKCFSNDLKC